jgi:hypothetical protein
LDDSTNKNARILQRDTLTSEREARTSGATTD